MPGQPRACFRFILIQGSNNKTQPPTIPATRNPRSFADMRFDEMTVQAVKTQLNSLQAAQPALPADLDVAGPVHANPHHGGPHPATKIFRATSSSLPYDLAIKAVDTGSKPDAGLWFEREADVLDQLAKQQDPDRLNLTSQLHLADAASGLLVTEWLEGRNLRRHFYLNMFFEQRRNVGIAAAGRWLSRLHDTWGRDTVRFDTSAFLEVIHTRIQENSGDRHDRHLRYLEVLRGAAARLADQPNVISLQHGDFSPNNLVIANDKLDLRAFDFSNPVAAPIEMDMAHFLLNRTVRLGTRLRTGSTSGLWQQAPQWQAFSKGYFGTPDHPPGPWLSWYALRTLLARAPFLHRFSQEPSRSRVDRFDRARELRRVEGLIEILAEDLSHG